MVMAAKPPVCPRTRDPPAKLLLISHRHSFNSFYKIKMSFKINKEQTGRSRGSVVIGDQRRKRKMKGIKNPEREAIDLLNCDCEKKRGCLFVLRSVYCWGKKGREEGRRGEGKEGKRKKEKESGGN